MRGESDYGVFFTNNNMNDYPKLSIYPGFSPNYYGFYILGIKRYCPKIKIDFKYDDFPFHYISYLAFEFEEKHILIDAMDFPTVDPGPLEWSDVCGKVNIPRDSLKAPDKEKIVPIGPSFGIQAWPLFKALPFGFKNYLNANLHRKYFRPVMGGYYHQFKSRLPENSYFHSKSDPDYIFSLHSYWTQEPRANEFRLTFLNCASRLPGIQFEGGFYSQKSIDNPIYKPFEIKNFYNLDEYINKTQRSLLVFNTPAVKGCVGWKLGEYLALGKAIISTEISQDLPEPLEHGKHIHFVDGSKDSIENAIAVIRDNRDYRLNLEENARAYYIKHLKPERVIERLLQAAGVVVSMPGKVISDEGSAGYIHNIMREA